MADKHDTKTFMEEVEARRKITDRIAKVLSVVGIGLVGMCVGIPVGFDMHKKFDMHNKSSLTKDVNNDGFDDHVIENIKEKSQIVYLGQKNGSYIRTEMRLDNGIPFYHTDKGYFTPYGEFFSNGQQKFKPVEFKPTPLPRRI